MSKDIGWEKALGDGLKQQELPNVSPDFDEKVLFELRRETLLQRLLPALRPMLGGACTSLLVTLVLIHTASKIPDISIAHETPHSPVMTAAIDKILDDPNLSAGTLSLWMYFKDAGPVVPKQENSNPETPMLPSQRRTQIGSLPTV